MSPPYSDIDLSLAHVEARIRAHRPNGTRQLGSRRSAVACVLRYERTVPDVLLMKRPIVPVIAGRVR